jgi:hypothetical protein
MTRSLPVWVGIGVAATIAIVAIMWTMRGARRANPGGVEHTTHTMPPPPEKGNGSDHIPHGLDLSGPSVVQKDADGKTVWSARSDGEFSVKEAERKVVGTGILWELTRGEDAVSVKAGRMELGWETRDVHFDEGVTITAAAGRRFEVAKARYEADTGKLICEGGVKWTSDNFTATAGTLVVDGRDKKIRLRGGVRIAVR